MGWKYVGEMISFHLFKFSFLPVGHFLSLNLAKRARCRFGRGGGFESKSVSCSKMPKLVKGGIPAPVFMDPLENTGLGTETKAGFSTPSVHGSAGDGFANWLETIGSYHRFPR